jgi:DNA-binding transcriptional LysR family regulator
LLVERAGVALGGAVHRVGGAAGVGEQSARLLQEHLADRGRRHPAAAADEQRRAELGLQRAHLLRERLLGDVQARGGARDAALLEDRDERAQLVDLRVGFLTTVAHDLMPPIVRAFGAHHPEVALETEDLPIAALVAGLRDGRLDAGLSRPALVDDLVAEPVSDEPAAAVLPAGHPLGDRAELSLADLRDEPWVLTPRSSWPPWHRKYDADFAAAGYRPRVVQRGTTPQALLALVAAGVGVTRLPLSSRYLRADGVAFVPLAGERVKVVLLTRPDAANPALRALRETVFGLERPR